MNKYNALRVRAEEIKRKINEGKTINRDELTVLEHIAHANPSNANMTAYAVAKRYLKEEAEQNE
ncbi:hypothetical protein [Metabacillus endolithicus]|uniref:Phage protein n=1 Tax=Metabacillus endolithicus TaxID=1535204 RepID=A0ABW5BUD5_9BACI|nr:hypothetical protein [Metabacillus endolithicus]UPG64737.1 hypothetical protein MVE64_06685 [Metabacillus endolithicus]